MRKIVAGVAVLVAVCVVGEIGYLLAGWGPTDGIYMVLITIFGVGYGEVQPVDSWQLRALTGFVIVAGYGAVIYTVGGFIQMVVDGEINQAFGARRMNKDIDALTGHTIICGHGRMGSSLARELEAAGRPFVAIDTDADSIARSTGGRLLIAGDATDEHTLERAGIARASVLATVLSDDAVNVFVTLTARAMNPSLVIIARGENRRTESKLRTCGADQVVMPTDIGASKMAQLIVRPSAEQVLDRMATSGDVDLVHLGLELDELELGAGSPWVNRAISEIEVRGAHSYLIVGVRTIDGTMHMHPPAELRLSIGDSVVVLGYHDDIPTLGARVTPRTVTYRGVTSEG